MVLCLALLHLQLLRFLVQMLEMLHHLLSTWKETALYPFGLSGCEMYWENACNVTYSPVNTVMAGLPTAATAMMSATLPPDDSYIILTGDLYFSYDPATETTVCLGRVQLP